MLNSAKQSNLIYLRINGDGNFYQSSKEPREGYVKHVAEKSGAISYWMEYKSVSGYLCDLFIRKLDVGGVSMETFNIKICDKNESYIISIPLYTSKGGLNNYVQSFTRLVENINTEERLDISCSHKKRDNGYLQWKMFFIKDPTGTNIPSKYTKDKPEGIPPAVKKTVMGKEVWDFTDMDNFLFEKLKGYISAFKESNHTNPEDDEPTAPDMPEAAAPSAPTPTPPPSSGEGDDDLPF